MTGQIRQNPVTGRWVIYAPGRGDRPKDFENSGVAEPDKLPSHDPDCPFCPGNEDDLPAIIDQVAGIDGGMWQTRVVPNKFPVLHPEADTTRRQRGPFLAMDGYGKHEVIIESPRHDQDIGTMPVGAVRQVIDTYHRRYMALMHEHGNMLALIFRNHGARAGTSLRHPHSQLVVTGVVPRYVREREARAQHYYDTWGRCLFADMLAHELDEGQRVVLENPSFVGFVPFAAEVPFEMWLIPRRQQADFGSVSEEEKTDLAHALRELLVRLRDVLGDPDYNYIINTAARYKADEPHLRWYVQIRPRLTTPAGFEIGSGMLVNPSLPEQNAVALRRDRSRE